MSGPMLRYTALAAISIGAVIVIACGTSHRDSSSDNLLASPAAVTLPAEIASLSAISQLTTVAAGLADGQVVVWNGRDAAPAIVLKPHDKRVLALGSTADGREVWSLASDGSLARTLLASGAQPTSLKLDLGSAATRAAAFSADGAMLVTGDEFGEIRIFDTASGALTHRLRGHRTELQSMAVQGRSQIIATASAEADLRIWDAAAAREIASVDGDLSLFALAFSPSDGRLASGGVGRRVTLHDPATFQPANHLALKAPKMVATVAWSPDGRLLAVGDLDDETLSKGGIQIVDAATRAVLGSIDTGNTPAGALVFAGDAGMLIAAIGRELRAWPVLHAHTTTAAR